MSSPAAAGKIEGNVVLDPTAIGGLVFRKEEATGRDGPGDCQRLCGDFKDLVYP